MGVFAGILVRMAIGLLDYFLARKGIKDSVKKDIALAGMRWARDAEAYKAENPVQLAPGDLLGPFKLRFPGDKPRVSGPVSDSSNSGKGTN